MSNADRIEELRTKYEENPRRYFAPLANEFRKAGDLAQAIAICREHLPKQPGHMSGYIVFGQTLFEANGLEEARAVFEQALALDPENLIALKHLGDIARMNGENSVARRWYARVLDADPRNDDIASQLASLGAATPAVASPAISEFAPPPPPAPERESERESERAFSAFEPGSLLDVPDDVVGIAGAHDQWAAATPVAEPQRASHHEPLDLDFPESPEPAADEEFEEGLLAPEWPDTSNLVARLVTPMRSATPISVPVTTDALDAFGRESFDAAEPVQTDRPVSDELVEAFLPTDQPRVPQADDVADVEAVVTFPSETPAPTPELDTSGEFGNAEFVHGTFNSHEFDSQSASAPVDFEAQEFESHTTNTASDIDAHEFESQPADATANFEVHEFELPQSHATTEFGSHEFDAQPTNATADEVDATFASSVDLTAETEVDGSADSNADHLPDIDVTAEFAIPSAWETAEPLAPVAPPVAWSEETPDDELLVTDAVSESRPEPHTPLYAAVVDSAVSESSFERSEESYAEISSEIQNERAEQEDEVAAAASAASDQGEPVQLEDAEAVAFPPSVVSEQPATFVTETMAELLVSQGFLPRAVDMYVELVRRRPHDPVLVARLAELQATEQREWERAEQLLAEEKAAQAAHSSGFSASSPTPQYNTPLYNTPRVTPAFQALQHTPKYIPQYHTPLGSTSHPTSALVPSISEGTPSHGSATERHVEQFASDRQVFRTARERFAELSQKRVARRTPTHATAVADDAAEGLSSLFGTAQPTTPDELAARALADAFGPVEDSGESLFDPAPTPTPSIPLRALTPRSVTPIPSATVDSRSDRLPATDYSFDKFFPDPAMAGRDVKGIQGSVPATEPSSQPVNEDLAQFSAWLKGLNNA